MKIIKHILIILAAALVVVGITLGLSKTSVVQNMVPTRSFEQRQPTSTTTPVASAQASTATTTENNQTVNATTVQSEFRGGHSDSGSLSNIQQVLQSLVIISLIILPFAVVPGLFNRGKKSPPSGKPRPPLDQTTYA